MFPNTPGGGGGGAGGGGPQGGGQNTPSDLDMLGLTMELLDQSKCYFIFILTLLHSRIIFTYWFFVCVGCWGVFVKRVNRGYTHTQYASTGDAHAIGDIPSSQMALLLSKRSCTTPQVTRIYY